MEKRKQEQGKGRRSQRSEMHLAGSLHAVKGWRGDPSWASMSIRENSCAQRFKGMLNPELGICIGKAKKMLWEEHTPTTFSRRKVRSGWSGSNTWACAEQSQNNPQTSPHWDCWEGYDFLPLQELITEKPPRGRAASVWEESLWSSIFGRTVVLANSQWLWLLHKAYRRWSHAHLILDGGGAPEAPPPSSELRNWKLLG